ncbi:50S ribosomal protein L24 [bacterium]|jgi:large subunit ribosomal protein L24|nr:50S ribosomal protein L24 [bacterium]MBT4121629.1 50S ribosomal protein L24 [bacterium]MBT4335106.1 50S ribosomal protein L24 [bacterium]MBT4495269.1 50S ribosomal protein L24 [bacterium]MBT4763893.1 50S ribosomal protein L24 [bacterium]
MKIKKGDNVKVTVGKDKGKTGKVSQVFIKQNKVVVEGLNIRFKHMKPKKQNEQGQRIEFSAPLDASNVMIIDPKSSKVSRIGYKTIESGEKIRISKKSGESI